MLQEPLLTWWEPVTQYLEFLAVFLPAGAVGFRYSSLRAGLCRRWVAENSNFWLRRTMGCSEARTE